MAIDGPLPATLIGDLLSGIRGVLADDLVGLYLYGSAVSGGFDPGVSDIDLLAVTASEVEALDLPALEQMHLGFVSRHPSGVTAWRSSTSDVPRSGRSGRARVRSL